MHGVVLDPCPLRPTRDAFTGALGFPRSFALLHVEGMVGL